MKVLPFKIPKPEQDNLIFQEDLELLFYDQLHQHEEIQFSIILSGEGSLIVGDTVTNYISGDVLIIGSNLPHVFKSDVPPETQSHMLTLFFTKSSFGPHFFKLNELQTLNTFFKLSSQGFKITSNLDSIKNLFLQLKTATKLQRFILLLQLLEATTLATHSSLSSYVYDKKYTALEGKRMRDVFEYTMSHFDQDINLNTIAEVAAMTKNAFCKYFKKRTNKSYFQFLNEVRIEHACKQIIKTPEYSFTQIAYLSGFKNISNFNRQFKQIKAMSPSTYKKTFM